MKRVLLQPAYVLHRRLYRETSFLVELFTPEYGRISVVARGVRKLRSSSAGLLQAFVPILVSFSGKGELMALTDIEANGEAKHLHGDCLFAGFYLNELLMCLLEKWDAHPSLFELYAHTLNALQTHQLEQRTLRLFEKYLLEELGYGVLPKEDSALQNSIQADKFYRFVPEQGFVVSELGDAVQSKSSIFSGKSLLAIAKEEWSDEASLQDAKRLTRLLLAPLLGARPIYSRQLFIQPEEVTKNAE